MTREEKEIFALQAYPPDLEGNGMTWPFIDRNEPYRNKLIAALESMEANGIEISIGGKIQRDNTLSKKILKEGQPQGLDEAAEEYANDEMMSCAILLRLVDMREYVKHPPMQNCLIGLPKGICLCLCLPSIQITRRCHLLVL